MAKEPKFKGTIAYSQKPVAGLTIYQEKKEQSISDMLDELVKDEVTTARKDELLAKIKTRRLQALKEAQDAESALREAKSGEVVSTIKEREAPKKRYLVDPETGAINVDEEEGEYTYKDALLVSASIKGKGRNESPTIDVPGIMKAMAEASKPDYAELLGIIQALQPAPQPEKPDALSKVIDFIKNNPDGISTTLGLARRALGIDQLNDRISNLTSSPQPTINLGEGPMSLDAYEKLLDILGTHRRAERQERRQDEAHREKIGLMGELRGRLPQLLTAAERATARMEEREAAKRQAPPPVSKAPPQVPPEAAPQEVPPTGTMTAACAQCGELVTGVPETLMKCPHCDTPVFLTMKMPPPTPPPPPKPKKAKEKPEETESTTPS